MTLSPTALEEAAKAYRDVTFNALTLDECRDASSAAITAYLAQAGKEGWVMVPRDLTPDMIVQGYEHVNRDLCEGRGNALNRLWAAMLAASQEQNDARPSPEADR